jgi:predicted NBD/HSP70 family sugar kinase
MARWSGASELLRLLHAEPGITRAAAARALGMSTGSATDVAARLRALDLLDERQAPRDAPGRPTTVLSAGDRGPLAAAIDVRHDDWALVIADLEGKRTRVAGAAHAKRSPEAVVSAIRRAVRQARRAYGRRLRVISVAVAGPVAGGQLARASPFGWAELDFDELQLGVGRALPVLVGNDATLAGIAEAHRRAADGARAVLHLTVEVGLGGVFVSDGSPVRGATGAAGEFGHLPFGDTAVECPCGARGCWELDVDGRAMARHRGHRAPEHPRRYAMATVDAARTDAGAAEAVERCASALGAGAAGLVNALDADLVTLGGLAVELERVARGPLLDAYTAGLMRFRRAAPPPLVPAVLGSDGPLVGAVDVALDHLLSPGSLSAWASELGA